MRKRKSKARDNKSRSKREKNGHLWASAVSLLCVINLNKFSGMKAEVCSHTSCPVPSHCFSDCKCARESVFFVLKLVARATNYGTIVLITNSIKICIIYHLNEERFHVDY